MCVFEECLGVDAVREGECWGVGTDLGRAGQLNPGGEWQE